MPTVTLEGARVSYEERGRGEAVILLHGWNSSRKLWLLNMRALAPQFRVIALDLPGYGESDDGPFPYTLDGMSSFLEAFMTRLRLPACHLAGHSMGGCIAVRFTARNPDRVRRLVLVSTPTRTVSLGIRHLLPGARSFVSLTYRLRSESMLKWMFCRNLYEPEEVDLDLMRANVKANALASRHALSRSTQLMRKMDLGGELRSIAQPTLVVFGDKDRNVNPREALRQRDLLPHSYMTVLASCAHCPPCERPDLFNTVLLDFLRDEGLDA